MEFCRLSLVHHEFITCMVIGVGTMEHVLRRGFPPLFFLGIPPAVT